jgi:hypothetical protein
MMRNHRSLCAIPLFGQNTDHSFVPARFRMAIVRNGCQGRPSGRRASAAPLTAVSAMARLRSLKRSFACGEQGCLIGDRRSLDVRLGRQSNTRTVVDLPALGSQSRNLFVRRRSQARPQ